MFKKKFYKSIGILGLFYCFLSGKFSQAIELTDAQVNDFNNVLSALVVDFQDSVEDSLSHDYSFQVKVLKNSIENSLYQNSTKLSNNLLDENKLEFLRDSYQILRGKLDFISYAVAIISTSTKHQKIEESVILKVIDETLQFSCDSLPSDKPASENVSPKKPIYRAEGKRARTPSPDLFLDLDQDPNEVSARSSSPLAYMNFLDAKSLIDVSGLFGDGGASANSNSRTDSYVDPYEGTSFSLDLQKSKEADAASEFKSSAFKKFKKLDGAYSSAGYAAYIDFADYPGYADYEDSLDQHSWHGSNETGIGTAIGTEVAKKIYTIDGEEFSVRNARPDGNCAIHSLSFGRPDLNLSREVIVERLLKELKDKNPAVIDYLDGVIQAGDISFGMLSEEASKGYLVNDEDFSGFQNYLKNEFSQSKHWFYYETIVLVAKLYHLNVSVYEFNHLDQKLILMGTGHLNFGESEDPKIRLLFNGANHYDYLEKVEGLTNISASSTPIGIPESTFDAP